MRTAKIIKKERGIAVVKIIICIFFLVTIIKLSFYSAINAFYNSKDYSLKNYNESGEQFDLSQYQYAEQEFIACGNRLTNVFVYYGDSACRNVEIAVKDLDNKILAVIDINTKLLNKYAWNELGLCTKRISRNNVYKLCISSKDGLEGFFWGNGEAPDTFRHLSTNGLEQDGHLLFGIKQTYLYTDLAKVFEVIIIIFFAIFIGMALCFSILKFERVYSLFKVSKKRGASCALFFSVSTILLYNPLDSLRLRVVTFKRVIGGALNYDMDVSRRIRNFDFWFILFGIVFLLLFMLSNYIICMVKTEEQKKIIRFMDNYMVFANCSLLLRCITFFKDDSASTTTFFCFYQNTVIVFAVVAICYVVFDLDRFMTVEIYEQIIIIIFCFSIVLSVFWGRELGEGRLVLGFFSIMFMLVLIVFKCTGIYFENHFLAKELPLITLLVAFIPLATSLYVELIHILNQHNIFVAHPAKYYKIACILGLIISSIIVIYFKKRHCQIQNWRKIVFPSLVCGITCLSIQIPISKVYESNIFEDANCSILLSDFFNYGDIPIVQHYGGHMMTGVWEGILYAILNNDFAGVISPYEELIKVVLAVLFYFVIAKIWNKEMALVISLFFPFMDYFSYYGLGMVVCLATMAFVNDNTIKKAAVLWGTFIWCALYRLDLGFAFGLAVGIALFIYVCVYRNCKALKMLGVTLLGWCVLGAMAWGIICFGKGINPISRFVEFLMINLSNQNWAYTEIGSMDNEIFAWGYIIIPLVMVLGLLYSVFVKSFREEIGTDNWMLLIILNLSYFQNFSRGLVRHSLVENSTITVFWCAYLFLAMFMAFYKNNMKWLIPSFMLLMLVNELFLSSANFESRPIAESAVLAPESIIESWKPLRFYGEENKIIAEDGTVFRTTWEKFKYCKEKVDRVELANDIKDYALEYKIVLDDLLDYNETFIDFINKTLLYSVLGYRCPVYVSQSPLQLSGEYTQEEFIKEIKGVPVVLMPIDAENIAISNNLDGVANAYRYYKVYEYIYSNYKPLCKYGDEYAIWCLYEKYDDYKRKVSNLMNNREYIGKLKEIGLLGNENIQLGNTDDSSVIIRGDGLNPMIAELQKIINVSEFIGQNMKIMIEYETDKTGDMKLYFTTDEGEDYTSEKVIDVKVSGSGIASFVIPITEYSRLGLSIPEGSLIKIKSLIAGRPIENIDYGYDGPIENMDLESDVTYSYISALHNISIGDLPRIWAENDLKDAIDNKEVCSLHKIDEYFVIDDTSVLKSENGNYLKISAIYNGLDTDEKYKENDENVEASIILGQYKNDKFTEKYRYSILFDEGKHDYLIRCSSDYYWYLKNVNAVMIDTSANLQNVSMSVLEGD